MISWIGEIQKKLKLINERRDEIKMVKKKENLLALGMLCLIMALLFDMFGNPNVIIDMVILLFVSIALFSNAGYLVMATSEKKKK
ncbi:MAG: hypothetical protein CEE42_12395 [Promethearchaeota archaeon Loki_b31]|nr:MAG: hypothetical protein CEE42_12395 [Candidatus Lokiarchaeota archaeon Loki_b31]